MNDSVHNAIVSFFNFVDHVGLLQFFLIAILCVIVLILALHNMDLNAQLKVFRLSNRTLVEHLEQTNKQYAQVIASAKKMGGIADEALTLHQELASQEIARLLH